MYRSIDRLSIIDPNDPANDIAGGSSNTKTIQKVFRHAHAALKERLSVLASRPDSQQLQNNVTILEPILRGNYSPFTDQRKFMRKLYEKSNGLARD